jgi:uncharacterized protein (TIGR02391 family)
MEELSVPISRPLPMDLLKKMFLKVLHEHLRPGGRYRMQSWDYNGIIRQTIADHFGIERLSEKEYGDGLRAVFELERDGFIMQDPSQSANSFKVLTDKGQRIVEQSLDDMQLSSIDIDQLLTHDDLRARVHDDYLAGDYETSIFKAFRLLEESVRAKAGLPAEAIGADLMTRAFRPNGGFLKHPNAQTPGEAEALHHLMRGAIMWFKNPSSHRTVGYKDPVEVAHVLGFANLLLEMLDQC